MDSKVKEQILALRMLPDCPNMFETNTVQRLAFNNGFFELVLFIEENKDKYVHFILTGEE